MPMNSVTYDYFNPSPWGSHQQLINLVGSNKVVLDIGCSTGRFASAVKQNNNIVYGIELNPFNADKARQVCDMVFVGDVAEIKDFQIETKFDVIILADILEHLRCPEKLLFDIRKLLKDNGYILVSIPNIAHIYVRTNLLLGRFNYQDVGLLDRTHLRFFTYKTAKDLLKNCGYKIDATCITMPNYPERFALDKKFYMLYKYVFKLSNCWKSGLAFQFIFKGLK